MFLCKSHVLTAFEAIPQISSAHEHLNCITLDCPKTNVSLLSENVDLDWVISETDESFCFEQFRGYADVAIIVKGEITITKVFNACKSMVKKNKRRMDEMFMVVLLPGCRDMIQLNFSLYEIC